MKNRVRWCGCRGLSVPQLGIRGQVALHQRHGARVVPDSVEDDAADPVVIGIQGQAVAADGEFASFCTVWFDDVTRTGAFEPVGTAPEHQRKGLGRAVMSEGLRRLQHLGGTLAYVGGFTPEANALYASVGFEDYDLCEPWSKEVQHGSS